jgi:hypothetical protein
MKAFYSSTTVKEIGQKKLQWDIKVRSQENYKVPWKIIGRKDFIQLKVLLKVFNAVRINLSMAISISYSINQCSV